ncbi:MAG: hypothetical protein V4560_13010 [Bacteroidota bacterium]
MKHLLFVILLFSSTVALAQNTQQTTTPVTKIMSGADLQKMIGNVTDRNIYDRDGNIIDSVTAEAKVKSFEYQLGFGTPAGQTGYKHVLSKIDPDRQMLTYKTMKSIPSLRLRSSKLQDGVVLDLKPLARRADTAKLTGKTIIMIFWCPSCYSGGSVPDQYKEINAVISNYYDPNKLQVLAITHAPFDVAAEALKKNPILNAYNIFEASYITDDYQTDNRPAIIMTDKNHKIVFSIAGHAAISPWMLNKLLKENIN